MCIAVPAVLTLLAGQANAAESAYTQCQDAAHSVMPALKACDGAQLARQDALLNTTYQTLMAALPPDRQEKLRDTERSWLAFASKECDFQMSAETGGMDAPLVYNACRLRLLAQRIDELHQGVSVARFLQKPVKP